MNPNHESPASRAWLAVALLPLGLFLALVWGLNQHALPWAFNWPWVPSLGIELAFRIDALSAQMLALITGIGTLIFVYAVGYLDHEPRRARIYLVLPLFMLAMIGAVSADHVILLFLFWELTSITSFLLVGFNHQDANARDSARQALLITMAGGLALLAGLLLLMQMAGSGRLSEIVARAPDYLADPRLPWAIILLLIGAFTKSAQFPFHFWLPNAMSAPTPVSAYLHSATMVKLGVYLMARLDPAFNDLRLWEVLLVGTGALTAIWAAFLTLRERDLKRILARSTVSALGTLTLLIGLPGEGAALAFVAFLFAHALYKAPLFMVAGNIDHATGTRIIDHLMGLRRVMPWTATAAVLAGLSMAGLPLAFGFVAKDLIDIAKAEAEFFAWMGVGLVFVSAVSAAVAGVAAIRVFWGPLDAGKRQVREAPWSMLAPPIVLVLMGIEFEFFPHLADPLLLAAAQVIAPSARFTEVSASYGLDKMLSASGITLTAGLLLFLSWDRLHNTLSRVAWIDRYGPEAGYHFLLRGLARLASWHTQAMQSGRLDRYLGMTLAAMLVMGLFVAWHSEWRFAWHSEWPRHAWVWLIAGLLMATGTVATARLSDRLAALMASGLVGFGAALLFLFAGAPDLAFTQFSVETALVVIAAALLPRFRSAALAADGGSLLNALRLPLAAAAGIGVLLLLLQLQAAPEHRELADWFGTNSLPQAHGRNVVNVIIVDFRALDTLGEIAVVAFALLAALPLLQNSSSAGQPAQQGSALLTLAAKPLYWAMLAGAAWILLRGHNEPGGGFIAGLTAVAASSLLALLRDTRQARRALPLAPVAMTLSGVLLALAAGLAGAWFGDGFLRHLWAGGLSSVLLFDLGVMLAVWGALSGYVLPLLDNDGAVNKKQRSNPT